MLLNKNPALRIGGSIERMKEHTWLKSIVWEELIEKKSQAPYIPVLSNLEWDIERAFTKKVHVNSASHKFGKFSNAAHSKVNMKMTAWDEDF